MSDFITDIVEIPEENIEKLSKKVEQINKKALKNGLIDIFNETGCSVTVVGCGACIGRRGGVLADNEKAFTTMNRNFIGRMGSPHSEIYLGSPAAAALTAIYGKITNPIDHLDELGESNE